MKQSVKSIMRVDIRAVITIIIFCMFGYGYISDINDETMRGAMIAAFSGAWGYWLGSSKGSADKAKELARKVGAE